MSEINSTQSRDDNTRHWGYPQSPRLRNPWKWVCPFLSEPMSWGCSGPCPAEFSIVLRLHSLFKNPAPVFALTSKHKIKSCLETRIFFVRLAHTHHISIDTPWKKSRSYLKTNQQTWLLQVKKEAHRNPWNCTDWLKRTDHFQIWQKNPIPIKSITGRSPNSDTPRFHPAPTVFSCLINHIPSLQSVAGKGKQNMHYSK